jgi:hypothetical protein
VFSDYQVIITFKSNFSDDNFKHSDIAILNVILTNKSKVVSVLN